MTSLLGFANCIMRWRARALCDRLKPYLPLHGVIADIGSGTGHNAAEMQRRQMTLQQYDVADLHWEGPPPRIFNGQQLPMEDQSVDAAMLLYVLHYCECPVRILLESKRVSRGSILVLQTTCASSLVEWLLVVQEYLFGRLGYYLARRVGLVTCPVCPLVPKRYYQRGQWVALFESAGFAVTHLHSVAQLPWLLHSDLFVLRASVSGSYGSSVKESA
ncbi:MAG: methyltransferase domain-containing protein [Pirellulaceae bacterium]